MHVSLILVSSLNGKITNGSSPDIYTWTSKEDQEYFFAQRDKSPLIIMGRKTYEASQVVIKLVPGKLRIIMTKTPENYASQTVPEQLEFTNESPKELVQRLEQQGYTEALVVGGNDIASAFLKEQCINTLYLTIEPILFGTGTLFFDSLDFDVHLQMINIKQLNSKGTLLIQYNLS